VPAGGSITIFFQSDDPFYTANGVDTDLDLFFVDPTTNLVVQSNESDNIADDTPLVVLSYNNTGGGTAKDLDLVVYKFTGPNPGRFKYEYAAIGNVSFPESAWAPNAPTVVQHAAAANGQGVAAAAYFQQDTPENFTSRGPATILFSPSGTPLGSAQIRNAPQLTGVDGTNNTFFGNDFPEADGKPNFFGTSAAAPHVAAVAALVRQANPGFTPAQVNARLQQTADDITSTGVGFDNVTGFGMVNAFDAIYPTVTPASLNYSDGLESGVLSSNYDTRATGAGRTIVTSANSPATGTKHLLLDSSISPTIGVAGVDEVVLHVNATPAGTKTLSFREREFGTEADEPMPATFTGSQNFDGVALSVDGNTWYRIVSLTGASSTTTYTLQTYDLSAIATANGITLGADMRIKFQRYGSFAAPGEGIAFDDISVTNTPSSLPAWLDPGSSATWNAGSKILTVTGAATIIADPGTDDPNIIGSSAAAVLTINPASDLRIRTASLNLTNGATATVTSLGGARTAANHRVLLIDGGAAGSVTIDANSKLDLTDNDLIVDYASPNPAASVEAMVAAGFNGGNWLGKRITSSVAANPASSGNFALAVADNATLTNKFGDGTGGKPKFAGQNVDDTSVLVKFSHRVDLDLTGTVSPNDAIIFATNFIQNGAGNWSTGDVDYDALHTQNDAIIFATFYNQALPPV
jgi:hypothetical protein